MKTLEIKNIILHFKYLNIFYQVELNLVSLGCQKIGNPRFAQIPVPRLA